jgi:hypothetical protein
MSCLLNGNCCDEKTDVVWFEDVTKIFCSLSPIPHGSLTSAERINAVTRLILYIFLLMLSSNYKFKFQFLIISLTFIFLLSKLSKEKKMTENYAFLSQPNNNNMNYDTLSQKGIRARHSDLVLTNMPRLASYTDYKGSDLQSFLDENGNLLPDPVIKERLHYQQMQQKMPMWSNNDSNNYKGDTRLAIKSDDFNFEGGQRVKNAGIQFYSLNQGVNRRTMVEPIITPRAYDLEYWGKTSTNIDRINRRNYTDITEDELFRQGGPVGGLGVEQQYVPRVKGAVEPMNNVGDQSFDGYYGADEFYYGQESKRDYEHNIAPIYSPELNRDATIKPIYNPTNVSKLEEITRDSNYLFNKNNKKNNIRNIDKEEMMNSFNTNQYNDMTVKATPNDNIPANILIVEKDPKYENWYAKKRGQSGKIKEGFDFMPLDSAQNVADTFGSLGKTTPVGQDYKLLSRVPEGTVLPKITPVTEQMLNASPTYVYNNNFFEDPSRRMFLQDIQPKIYSWAVEQTPINSNVGISYNPQIPPRVLDQVYSKEGQYGAYPLYTRIDPQLVRTDGTAGELANNPTRTNWSAEYSNWVPPPGTINFENIYDPRFTSYGDPYRSYSDINLGQVQYYYSDVDAYTMPNFISRSNVDFMEYRTPQNQIWPEYERTASADQVKPFVESQYAADNLFFREDLMEHQMSKRNRELWQLRQAPLSRAANSNMPFGPT